MKKQGDLKACVESELNNAVRCKENEMGSQDAVVLVLVCSFIDKHSTAVVSLAQLRGWICTSNTLWSDSPKSSNENIVRTGTDYCHIPCF